MPQSGKRLQKKGSSGSGLSDFKRMMSDFRSITGYAAGGAGTLPIVAALAGVAPPWPPSVGPLTSILVLMFLIITYHVFSGRAGSPPTLHIIGPAAVALLSIVGYLGLLDTFTFRLPTTQEQIVVGCGYTEQALQVAHALEIEVGGGCPGQFHYLLSTASFDNYRIWSNSSLLAIKLVLFLSWLLFFCSLALAIGVFIVFQRDRRDLGPTRKRAGATLA